MGLAEAHVIGARPAAAWAHRVALVAGGLAVYGLARAQPGLASAAACGLAMAFAWSVRYGCARRRDGTALLIGLWTAMGLVPHVAFCLAVAAGAPLAAWHVQTLDAVTTGLVLAWAVRAVPRGGGKVALRAALTGLPAGALSASLALGLLFSLRHGGALSPYSCVQTAASAALGHGAAVDLLRQNVGDAQLGNAALIAGLWLRNLELHHLHGLCGATLAMAGWSLGRSAGGNDRAGWAGLVALACNPLVLAAPLADENAFAAALFATVLAVALSVHTQAAFAWVGAAFGLVFAVRHPLAVCGPAVAWLAWRQASGRGLVAFALGAGLSSAFEHAHHVLAFGSLWSFETHTQVPPQRYELLGVALSARGLMNWPLHDALVRTPHNAWPMWVQWPLHALAHLGLLAAAALAVGALRWLSKVPRELLWWTGLLLPVAAGLGVQEGWDYPNKMGVGLVFVPVLAPLAGRAAAERWTRRTFAAAGVALVGLVLASRFLTTWLPEVPMDPRHGVARRAPMVEWPAWLQAERLRLRPALLPDVAALWRHGPPFARALHDDPPVPLAWMWHADELAGAGGPTDWRVDLSDPPLSRGSPAPVSLAPLGAVAGLDLSPQGTHFAPAVAAPWQPGGLAAWGTADGRLAVLRLEAAALHHAIGATDAQFDDRCRGFDAVCAGASLRACAARHRAGPLPAQFVLRTPVPRLSLVFAVSDSANVWVMWRFARQGAALTAAGPFVYWHN